MESLFLTGPSTEILFDASKLYDAYRRKNRISGPLDEIYTASAGRRLLMEVGKCDVIGEAYKGLFERFIGKVSDFL